MFKFFLYLFLGAILILLGFLAYPYLLSHRVKRVTGKLSSQNLASQQTKGNYDVDWIPKHHLVQSK
jgi:NADH:ubiquinone oxidoreductase subunit 4 (subunit M)